MGDPSAVQVILSPEEFAEDLDLRLGRANGNIYHRRPGIDGIHDGQVMVRLKKKRFIVLDYGIIPNEADFQTAVLNPHIIIPDGAGKQKCSTADCPKVGVPVCLYDSNPGDTHSLYLRAGLCFTCQRNLNEKRRTQRKRKSDIIAELTAAANPSYQMSTSTQKKFKVNGDVVELSPEAIIVNGPVEDAKPCSEGYGYPEIGPDLQNSLREAAEATERLVAAVSSSANLDPTAVAFAAAVAAAGEGETGAQSEDSVAAANAAVAAATVTTEDITSLYEKAFLSMSKGIFLLSQWKASWDSAIAAAVAQESDGGLADAVASAAAVVAVASEGQDQNTTGMIPLILAAESEGTKKKEDTQEVFSV